MLNEPDNKINVPHPQNFWVKLFELKSNISLSNSISLMDRYTKIKTMLQDKLHADCQIFSPGICLSLKHLELVLFFVEKTFRMKNNISSQPAMEFLLYLSRQRQIKSAIETSGIVNAKDKLLPSSFGFVVFGSPMTNDISNDFLSPFLELYTCRQLFPPSMNELIHWISSQKLSDPLLRRYFLAYSIPIPSGQNIFDNLSSFSVEQLEQILLDILTEQMTALYLSNQKSE